VATSAGVIGAVLLALFGGGGLAAFLLIKPQSAKLAADTAQSLTVAASAIVEECRRENAELRERVINLEAKVGEIATLRRDRDRLSMRVAQLGQVLEQNGIAVPTPLRGLDDPLPS
jgi:phage shock protein A